jgi:hypothetical protein
MVMEQLDNLHKLVVVVENNLDQDLVMVNLVYLLDFVDYSSNLVVFDENVVVGDFVHDYKNRLNDVIHYLLDQEEHRYIYDVEQTIKIKRT